MLLMFSPLAIEMLIGICYSLLFQICKVFFSSLGSATSLTSKSAKVESLFFHKIGNSTFQWFTSSWPLYSKTPATTSHSHSLNTSKVESLFFPKNWQLYFSVVYLFLTPLQQNSGHYIPFPQPEHLKSRVPFFSENLATLLFQWFTSSWPLYSKTPATTSHSHSLKTLKSRVPFFSEKLATLLFSGLPLLDPCTAKLRPPHPIPTARKPQK